MKLLRVLTLLVLSAGLCFKGQSQEQLIYQEQFTADPNWTTDNPTDLRWDAGTQTFHGTSVNTEASFAFINLPGFDANKPWRLEFDYRINSLDWSSGLTFGLFDSRLSYPDGAGIDIGNPDMGLSTGVWGGGEALPSTFNPAWVSGVWYHAVLEFIPGAQTLALSITNSSTGARFLALTMPVSSLRIDTTRLGVSRVHVKGGGGVSPSATADYSLDNIRLFGLASPSVVYTEQFNANPNWATGCPGRFQWDSETQSLHGTSVNSEGCYAYVDLPGFDPSKPWRLELDYKINSLDWSSGLTFGLYDSRLSYPFGAGIDIGNPDMGRSTGVWGGGEALPSTFNPAWASGVWYHAVLEFTPGAQTLALSITNAGSGVRFVALSMPVTSLSADVTRLGISRVHVKGGGGVSGSATADYNIDNIRLFGTTSGVLSLQMYSGIKLTGVAGRTYRVEFSTDLGSSWATLTTVTATTGSVLVFDPQSPERPRAFYRAILVP